MTEYAKTIFNETGLLMVENALSPKQVTGLTTASDRLYAQKLAERHEVRQALFYSNFIQDDPLFTALVGYDRILPKVWGLPEWNIYLYHAHPIVTPPSGPLPDDKTFGWHQDSGRVNVEIECHPRPCLSLKVACFLSDTSEPGRGNFRVVPGSHPGDTPTRSEDGAGQTKGKVS